MKWITIIVVVSAIAILFANAWNNCPLGLKNVPSHYGIRSQLSAISRVTLKENLVVTFFLVLFAALLTEIIAKKAAARYIWNIILLILFMLSAISGVSLLFTKDLIKIHTISSLLLLWTGSYHILKHAKYYLRI